MPPYHHALTHLHAYGRSANLSALRSDDDSPGVVSLSPCSSHNVTTLKQVGRVLPYLN